MYSGIVVGTDGSETATTAVVHAAGLAKGFGVPLHLVSAYRVPMSGGVAMAVPEAAIVADGEWQLHAQAEVERMLDGLAERYRADGVTVLVHACPGDPVRAMLDVAVANGADLIVVGNKGMKGARRILGSVPNSIAHAAECHVLIVSTT